MSAALMHAFLAALLLLLLSTPRATAESLLEKCDRLAGDQEDSTQPNGLWDYEVQVDAAVSACSAAMERAPNSARARYNLGRALLLHGDVARASTLLQEAADLQHPRALSRLADLRFGMSESDTVEGAYDLCKKAMVLGDKPGASCIVALKIADTAHGGNTSMEDAIVLDAIKKTSTYARAGDARALYTMAIAITKVDGKPDEIWRDLRGDPHAMLEQSANRGFLPAMAVLGRELTKQPVRNDEYYRGLKWLKRAAELGDQESDGLFQFYCESDETPMCQ
jgi:TPR repeat protein